MSGVLEKALDILTGLEINREAMHKNLDTTNGLIMAEALMMALDPKIGRMTAHHLVEKICKQTVKENRHLREVVQETSEITEQFPQKQLEKIFDPANYLGNIQTQIDTVLNAKL